MSEGTHNSLVNLGNISKPADTLIKKVSKAVGGVFAPYQIRRIAKAEAEAAIIKAQTEIEITDLHRRALHRFVEEEAKRQANIEQITDKALPQLQEGSDPSSMEDDWLTNFFDKSRIVSDAEMQDLWARVLAGEANAPGRYSKRTVNFLGDLDRKDAELFQTLCRFGWIVGDFTPLIFDPKASIYSNQGLGFAALTHLDSIGLIQFAQVAEFQRTDLPKTFAALYCNQLLELTMEGDSGNKLPVGRVLLTKVGRELATVCKVPGVNGFYDYVKEKWKEYLPDQKKAEEGGAANADKPGV